MSMALCSGGGLGSQRFLYEARPDLFPQGFLTEAEIMLWIKFAEEMKDRNKK